MVKSRAARFDNARSPLILQAKFEDIQRYTHDALFQFPKKERYLLCAQIQRAVEEVMHLIIRFKLKYYKKTTLQDIDVEIDYLRVLVRASHMAGYISTGKRGEWIEHLNEAGRIVGGLKKVYCKEN
jgi:hypothetical protein